jgi:uncharacterized membrane protein YfcA
MTMSVSPGELSAGVGKVAALFGDCEKATAGVAETLSGMTGVAGHPGLVSALTTVTEASTKALVSTGQALTFIAAGLNKTADQYSKTESGNTDRLHAAGSGS